MDSLLVGSSEAGRSNPAGMTTTAERRREFLALVLEDDFFIMEGTCSGFIRATTSASRLISSLSVSHQNSTERFASTTSRRSYRRECVSERQTGSLNLQYLVDMTASKCVHYKIKRDIFNKALQEHLGDVEARNKPSLGLFF
ncbi:hypothetical protein OG21DRAFT_1508883 [Imleria badia]|nr:hypothetical protein OG21DRAFT_1508883 [Imleria badia]